MRTVYILGNQHAPERNLALEEYAFRNLTQFDRIFMLWRNAPSIIVGKHQNTLEEINIDYVERNGIAVVRRISGGGAVYHDLKNLNFTIITNEKSGIGFDLRAFTLPIVQTLLRLGICAEVSPRNDLRVNGKKICGTAQAFLKGRMMFHGCLLFDADLSALSHGLKAPTSIIRSKSVKSVRSEVANIADFLLVGMNVEGFMNELLLTVQNEYPDIAEYQFSAEEEAEATQRYEAKYSDWEWNYAQSPAFSVRRTTHTPAGEWQADVSVRKGRISELSVTLDGASLDSLPRLVGTRYRYDEIVHAGSADWAKIIIG